MRLRHLVHNFDALANLRRISHRNRKTFDRVLNVDECPCLTAGAMHRQRMTNGCLHQEAVENRSIVAIVIKAVDQTFIQTRLLGLSAPDNTLMQVSDANIVVLDIELEHQLIHRLRHMIDAARIGRIEDRAGQHILALGDKNVLIAFRNLQPVAIITVNTHRAQMNHVNITLQFGNRDHQIVCRIDVVVHRVNLFGRAFHRIRRSALFAKMNDRIRLIKVKQCFKRIVFRRDIHIAELDFPPGNLFPSRQTIFDGRNGGE